MAKLSSTPLTLVQPHFTDLPAAPEELLHHLLVRVRWETANKHRTAVRRPGRFGDDLVLPTPISVDRLVLGKVHANRHTLDDRARQVCSLVHSLRLKELHVAEVAVAQLIHLQTDQLYLPTRLEQIDHILLGRVY